MPLVDAIEWGVGYRDIFDDADRPVGEGSPSAILGFMREIRQQAGLGRMRVWGKEGVLPEFSTWKEIPKEHWENSQIDYVEYIRDRAVTENGFKYEDLHFYKPEFKRAMKHAKKRPKRRLKNALQSSLRRKKTTNG